MDIAGESYIYMLLTIIIHRQCYDSLLKQSRLAKESIIFVHINNYVHASNSGWWKRTRNIKVIQVNRITISA